MVLRVFDGVVLRRIFGPHVEDAIGVLREVQNVELYNF
jgi:hypothetical protein